MPLRRPTQHISPPLIWRRISTHTTSPPHPTSHISAAHLTSLSPHPTSLSPHPTSPPHISPPLIWRRISTHTPHLRRIPHLTSPPHISHLSPHPTSLSAHLTSLSPHPTSPPHISPPLIWRRIHACWVVSTCVQHHHRAWLGTVEISHETLYTNSTYILMIAGFSN